MAEDREDAPPFSPEQLAWIDRLVAARQDSSLPSSSGGSSTGPSAFASEGPPGADNGCLVPR